MTFFELLKDIVVPFASPLVAALAIIFALRSEGRRLRIQKDHERSERHDSIFTDAQFARCQLHVLVRDSFLGTLPQAHVDEFQATIDRIYDKIFPDYRAGHELSSKVKFSTNDSSIFMLLAELRYGVISMDSENIPHPIIPFGLHTLLYLYDADDERRNENYNILEGDEG